MKKLPSIQPADRVGEAIGYVPNAVSEKTLTASKGLKSGQKLGKTDDAESLNSGIQVENSGFQGATEDQAAVVLGAETVSSLPGLLEGSSENFTQLAQAPAAVAVSAASEASSAGLLAGASATQIGAIALGVVAVGAAASSGGGGSSAPAAVAAPTVAANASTGAISVTIGSDASTAKLYAGSTDITSKFTSATVGSVVTFTPVSGQVEYTGQAITAKAANASGTLSVDSSSVSYTFDNVPPAAAPTVAAGAAGAIAVTIGADATAAKLFAGTTDITSKFTAAKVGSVVTFTPVAGQVEYSAAAVTAKAADAAGNLSGSSAALTYSFDGVPPAAAPTVADGAAGAIAVTIGADATTAALFSGTTDISSKFTATKVGSVVTFTPVSGQVEYSAAAVTAKAADAAGNLSGSSAALTYSFDNVPPAAAPTVAAGTAGAIAVTIGADATTAALFSGTTDISSKFTAAKVGSVVTFTPVAGQVEYSAAAVTAKAADAAGNLSGSSAALTYSFDNVPPAAAPTIAAGAAGSIAVTIGADAATAALYAGATDISSKFTSVRVGSVVTFTPAPGQVEYALQAVTSKAADASGNLSTASSPVSYSYDNVAPPAPSSVDGSSTSGAVTVGFGTASGQVASSVHLFAGSTDIGSKYVADASVAGKVTFTPIAGQVDLTAQTLTATIADAAGNVSPSASSAGAYSFKNAIAISSTNAAAGFDAASANYAYTVAEGTYAVSIAGFQAGDLIEFKGTSAPAVSIVNTSAADGVIAITASYGSNVVDMTLTGVAPVSDAQVLGVTSFNNVFGAGSLKGSATSAGSGSSAVTINTANSSTAFDAAGSNVAYTVSEGTYNASVANFAAGDSINFSGASAAALSVVNSTSNDGSVVITGNFGSNVVDLTLTGLTASQDGAILGANSFNNLFGAGSLGSTAIGQGSATSTSVSASNAAAGFNASSGNFAYTIAEGTYATTITGFGPGDSLSFFGAKVAGLSVVNTSGSDGLLLITGVVDGQAVDVTLSGLSVSLDGQVFGVNSFNNVFGAGSLIA
jgi:hypothetical protein